MLDLSYILQDMTDIKNTAKFQIIEDKKTPCFPSMTLEEIEANTKILDDLINIKTV